MYITHTSYPVMDGEPHLGTITESELNESEGEALALLITYMADQQECPTTFSAIDDYSDEDIELETSTYLSNSQIDMLNDMFMETDDWSEEHLEFLIRYRAEQETADKISEEQDD